MLHPWWDIQDTTSLLTPWGFGIRPNNVGTAVSLINSFFEKPALYCAWLRKQSALKCAEQTVRFGLKCSGMSEKINLSHWSLMCLSLGRLCNDILASWHPRIVQRFLDMFLSCSLLALWWNNLSCCAVNKVFKKSVWGWALLRALTVWLWRHNLMEVLTALLKAQLLKTFLHWLRMFIFILRQDMLYLKISLLTPWDLYLPC